MNNQTTKDTKNLQQNDGELSGDFLRSKLLNMKKWISTVLGEENDFCKSIDILYNNPVALNEYIGKLKFICDKDGNVKDELLSFLLTQQNIKLGEKDFDKLKRYLSCFAKTSLL